MQPHSLLAQNGKREIKLKTSIPFSLVPQCRDDGTVHLARLPPCFPYHGEPFFLQLLLVRCLSSDLALFLIF